MRDNRQGMPELVSAVIQNDHYFAVVQLQCGNKEQRFQFPVTRGGYHALRRVFELRPFSNMPGAKYRFFFVPSVRRLEGDRVMMTLRVEQGSNGKQLETEAPRDLVANLMWFFELKDWRDAEHLAVA